MSQKKLKHREIKFRIWDKKDRRWIEPEWVDLRGSGKVVRHRVHRGVEIAVEENPDDLIIVQYTGLKDKNGKEIYEGDIVKNHWYNCDDEFIGKTWEVRYGEHSIEGLDYYSNMGEGYYFHTKHEEYNIANLPCDEDKGIEVIGNIYENLDLLDT